jgi:hypothetical protein
VTCVAFSIKFAKTNQKFAENSEFCEKNSLLLVNYSLHSLVSSKFESTAQQQQAESQFLLPFLSGGKQGGGECTMLSGEVF